MKQAMIFAAGLGTRLKPLTDTRPKALVEVGGMTLLERVIRRLRQAGFDRVVVNVHHFSSQVIDFLKRHDNFGLDIRISDETGRLLDTGGGIRKAMPLFDSRFPILIHNVDILSNVDLARFYTLDEKVTCLDCGVPHLLAGAQLLVSWRRTKRYLVFNRNMLLVGWVNVETGEVKTPWPEVRGTLAREVYPLTPGDSPVEINGLRLYAFSGIHVFYPRFFPSMVGCPDKFPIMDFYLEHCGKTPIKGYCKHDLRLLDVGKLESLKEAEAFVE